MFFFLLYLINSFKIYRVEQKAKSSQGTPEEEKSVLGETCLSDVRLHWRTQCGTVQIPGTDYNAQPDSLLYGYLIDLQIEKLMSGDSGLYHYIITTPNDLEGSVEQLVLGK